MRRKFVPNRTKKVTRGIKIVLLWPLNVFLWQNIDFIGLVMSFLVDIDPNSFGLVFIKTIIDVL